MKSESYVVEEKILVIREEQPEDVHKGEEFDPSSSVHISEDDPRLNEIVQEIDPRGDAYEPMTTISIY
jgi:hypothetical protein